MQDIPLVEGRSNPKLVRLWQLQALLPGLAAGALAALLIAVFNGGRAGWGGPVLAGLAVAIAVSLPLLWRARVAARVYRWQRLPGEGVVVWKGAWWQREVWIPLTRLQHLDIQRNPLERWLGLATLELYTAGSRAYQTRLPGLEPPQAQALRDALLAELQARAAPAEDRAA